MRGRWRKEKTFTRNNTSTGKIKEAINSKSSINPGWLSEIKGPVKLEETETPKPQENTSSEKYEPKAPDKVRIGRQVGFMQVEATPNNIEGEEAALVQPQSKFVPTHVIRGYGWKGK